MSWYTLNRLGERELVARRAHSEISAEVSGSREPERLASEAERAAHRRITEERVRRRRALDPLPRRRTGPGRLQVDDRISVGDVGDDARRVPANRERVAGDLRGSGNGFHSAGAGIGDVHVVSGERLGRIRRGGRGVRREGLGADAGRVPSEAPGLERRQWQRGHWVR